MLAKTKLILNISMYILFMLLMADRYTGNIAHELIGITLIFIIIIHNYIHKQWYINLLNIFNHKTFIIRTILNIIMVFILSGTIISSLFISKTVFTFLEFNGGILSRTIHIFFAHWLFIISSLHLGIYWRRMNNIILKYTNFHIKYKNKFILLITIFACYGIYAFYQRELIYPLTMQSAFMMWSEDESIGLFILDYIAIFFLGAWISAILSLVKRYTIPLFHTMEKIKTREASGTIQS